MAVFIRKSGVITNRDASPPLPSDLRTAGRNFMKRARVLTVTADSIGSMYGFFTLPANAVVVSCLLSNAALSASTTVDIGLWETPLRGGFSSTTGWLTLAGGVTGADQFFGDAVAMTNAATKAEQLLANTNFYTLLNADQMIWQVLGLAADPQTEYDLVVVAEAAIVAGGTILLEVTYKMQ